MNSAQPAPSGLTPRLLKTSICCGRGGRCTGELARLIRFDERADGSEVPPVVTLNPGWVSRRLGDDWLWELGGHGRHQARQGKAPAYRRPFARDIEADTIYGRYTCPSPWVVGSVRRRVTVARVKIRCPRCGFINVLDGPGLGLSTTPNTLQIARGGFGRMEEINP